MTPTTPHAPARHTSTRRAFTLTELLVVVVIIIILISILLPAVGGARNSARRATTKAFMSSINQAVAQFRAAEQRLPGYFSVKDVGNADNLIDAPDTNGIRGLTYLESAMLDLAGGVYRDQDATEDPYNDANRPPDIIKVGVGASPKKHVLVQRTAIGGEDGPGYLEMPEGFVDVGGLDDGRAGKWTGHKWMPRLVDSWGMPLLMWPRDEFAKREEPLVQGMYDGNPNNTSAPFYWVGNSAFTNATRLGRDSQKNQWIDSALSSDGRNPRGSEGPLAKSVAAIVGHPAFPVPNSLADSEGPAPAQPRGDVVLHSAGVNGIFLETKGGDVSEFRYVPDGYDFAAGDWDPEPFVGFVDQTDDVILSGS